MELDRDKMLARYRELCDKRDAAYAECAPLEAKLAEANARTEAARTEAADLATKIEARRGGGAWLKLKREIADIAAFLRKIPPRDKSA